MGVLIGGYLYSISIHAGHLFDGFGVLILFAYKFVLLSIYHTTFLHTPPSIRHTTTLCTPPSIHRTPTFMYANLPPRLEHYSGTKVGDLASLFVTLDAAKILISRKDG